MTSGIYHSLKTSTPINVTDKRSFSYVYRFRFYRESINAGAKQSCGIYAPHDNSAHKLNSMEVGCNQFTGQRREISYLSSLRAIHVAITPIKLKNAQKMRKTAI